MTGPGKTPEGDEDHLGPISEVEYIGPFEASRVVVDGYRVPLLEAHEEQGGRMLLTLDSRYGLEIDIQTAERVVPWVANAIAIAAGFSCHGEAGIPLHPYKARRLTGLGLPSTEDMSDA